MRGAWIEMPISADLRKNARSLPVRGAWIEIVRDFDEKIPRICRSPCGERGLKYVSLYPLFRFTSSLPVRGAWIEMPSEGERFTAIESLPVRGAWIEITSIRSPPSPSRVAPRAGSVD